MSGLIPVDNTLDERRDARRGRQIAALPPAERRLFEIVVADLGPVEALKLARVLVDALHRKVQARVEANVLSQPAGSAIGNGEA